jgi:hypothetical protein
MSSSQSAVSHRGRTRVLVHDVWEDLRYLANVEVDLADSAAVAELLRRTRTLATRVLDSPKNPILEQHQELQKEHERAVLTINGLNQELETQKSIVAALARIQHQVQSSGVAVGDGTGGGSVARPKLAELTDPPKFNGTRKDLRTFVAQLRIKLHGNAQSFPTLQHRLSYAVGRLEGVAFDQVLPYINDTAVNLGSVDALIKILDDAFGDPDRVATATRELKSLRQANREFSLYFADFQRLSAETDWNDAAKRDALQSGLSEELKDALMVVNEEEEYSAFIKQLQKLDNKLRARQADKKKGGANTGKSGLAPARSSAQGAIPNSSSKPSNSGHPTQSGSGYYGPAPMDLSLGKHVTPEEKARRIAENLCHYCAGSDHMLRACPVKPQAAKLRGSAAAIQEPGPQGSPVEASAGKD